MAGPGIFKHDAIAVIGLADDNRKTVAVPQIQILLVKWRRLFHRYHPFAVDDRNMQLLFQITVNRAGSNLPCQVSCHILPEGAAVQDQRPSVQIVQTLDRIQPCPLRKAGLFRQRRIGRHL